MDAIPADSAFVGMTLNSRLRRGSSLAKILCLCTLMLAACEPGLMRRSNISVTVLADTSASISDRDLKHESDLIRRMESGNRDHIFRVIQFAQSTSKVERMERIKS
jgi:hypothetical protein